MTAEAIAQGQPIPDEAVETMARLLLPTWLVLPVLNGVTRRWDIELGGE